MAPKARRNKAKYCSVADGAKKRSAGSQLFKHLLGIYLSGKTMSARDIAIACRLAHIGGMIGAPWADWGMSPNNQSGRFKHHVDAQMPDSDPLYSVEIPMVVRGEAHRSKDVMDFALVFKSLADEVANSKSMQTMLVEGCTGRDSVMTTRQYLEHQHVTRALDNDRNYPLPIALYTDAVRYTPLHAGQTDSILNVSICNLLSNKRHYVGFIRTLDECGCGCQGNCSINAFLEVTRWILQAAVDGRVPDFRHDGSRWESPDELAQAGKPLGYSAVLMYVKGDWAEFAHTFGMAQWNSIYHPCPCCVSPSDSLYHTFPGFITADEMPFQGRTHDSYAHACNLCEVELAVTSEPARRALCSVLAFRDPTTKTSGGLVVTRDLPGTPLVPGDRLDPSSDLPNIRDVFERQIPFTARFWRIRRDHKGRSIDWLAHRSPIFDDRLLSSPDSVLALDSLHTVYLGCAQRVCSAILWRLVEANPFGISGQKSIWKRIETDMKAWFEEADVPHDRRLGRLTAGMMGSGKKTKQRVRGTPHPGFGISVKAAESSILLDFAVMMCHRHSDVIQCAEYLASSGEALQSWLSLTRTCPARPTMEEFQPILDDAMRFILYAEESKVKLTPKFHLFCHLTQRSHGTHASLVVGGRGDSFRMIMVSNSVNPQWHIARLL